MPLDLKGVIRPQLIGLEETIINHLIERAQFGYNKAAYIVGGRPTENPDKTYFQERLFRQECLDSKEKRFTDPGERPFSQIEYLHLPEEKRDRCGMEKELQIKDYNSVNVSGKILEAYFDLLPKICKIENDRQYGSSTEYDMLALKRISQRIHYAAFYVAESKYQEDPTEYSRLIISGDTDALMDKLKDKTVENMIIERVNKKVKIVQGINPWTAILEMLHLSKNNNRVKLGSEVVADFYRDTIIPLTCEGEIAYFMNRLNLALTPGQDYSFEWARKERAMGFGTSKPSKDQKINGTFLYTLHRLYNFRVDGHLKNFLWEDMANIRNI